MPGLNQLKQFNSDLLNLGDEVKIRSARGEKPSLVPIPKDVKDIDDSEDFKNGMPKLSEEEQAQADAAAAEAARELNDFSDITGSGDSEEDAVEEAAPAALDMSSLLAPDDSLSLDDFDLSEFEEPAKPKEPPKPKEIPIEDLDLDALLAPKPEPKPEPAPAPEPASRPAAAPKPAAEESDFDLEDFGKPEELETVEPVEELSEIPEAEEIPAAEEIPSEPVSDASTDSDFDTDFNTDNLDFGDLPEMKEAEELSEAPEEMPAVDLSDLEGDSVDSSSGEAEGSDSDSFDIEAENREFAKAAVAGDGLMDMNAGLPEELNEMPGVLEEDNLMDSFAAEASGTESAGAEGEEVPAAEEETASAEPDIPVSLDDFDTSGLDDVPAADSADTEASGEESSSAEPAMDDFNVSDLADIPDLDNMDFSSDDSAGDSTSGETDEAVVPGLSDESPDTEESTGAEENTGAEESSDTEESSAGLPDTDFNYDTDGLDGLDGLTFDDDGKASDAGTDFNLDDLPDLDMSGSSSISPEMSVPETEGASDEDSAETFDTSDINNLDFSSNTMSGEGTDFELGNITAGEKDEDDLFSIPGFSDTQTADLNRNKPDVSTPDFSDAMEGGDKPKNTFTDAEYKRFQKNLAEYPLNVRIAIEDLVVKNEFTDDAVFAILEKVLRKAPARQIATDLEKMLDITLEVPRDFERRSAQEYELYKKSLEYQLKNRIIPGAIITAGAAILIACLFLISWTFIYKPSMASKLYKQGYVLLEENQYPQALDKFNKALTYKTVKDWFYKYAQAFRKHKQYDRSASLYKAILAGFDHEKQAGMEWADMEMNDLYNYEETERILKREVLDYHINDSDATLMLGDLYLDWATESDPSKFADAKEQYDKVLQVGKAEESNKYLARQMRWYIRTDNLRQVLAYKEYFYPIKKGGLDSKDLTELSGYMLDKMYGKLLPAEESLRFSIENVRELLERAVKADPENPVALYNMGRYFIETGSSSSVPLLKESISQFKDKTKRNRSETYKYINAYRLLGEEYSKQKEYILAEEQYGSGISIFEKEHEDSGFESDENVGKLYSDIGDMDYFISGDMDRALTNYENSVINKNDTASVRYKIGYIQYTKQDYGKAMGSFIRSNEMSPDDTHLLLALANTLSMRNDYLAAEGYYSNLMDKLNSQRELRDLILPQVRSDDADLVDVYMRASNNLGVTLARQAELTGNSGLNAKALVNFQNSLRAWDALTRNQTEMTRLEGSNLAEQNVKYLTNPSSKYSPEIYTDIFKLMSGEEGLEK